MVWGVILSHTELKITINIEFTPHSYLVLRRESTLHTLDLPPQLLDSSLVGADINALFLLDRLHHVRHHALVKVLAAKVGVTYEWERVGGGSGCRE